MELVFILGHSQLVKKPLKLIAKLVLNTTVSLRAMTDPASLKVIGLLETVRRQIVLSTMPFAEKTAVVKALTIIIQELADASELNRQRNPRPPETS
jgi:hypothetical protein